MHLATPVPQINPPTCLPGCVVDHRPADEWFACVAPTGVLALPSQHLGEHDTVEVEVHRDVDADGSLRAAGVHLELPGVLPMGPSAARRLAGLLLAAADEVDRVENGTPGSPPRVWACAPV